MPKNQNVLIKVVINNALFVIYTKLPIHIRLIPLILSITVKETPSTLATLKVLSPGLAAPVQVS